MKAPKFLTDPALDNRPLSGRHTNGHLLSTTTQTEGWWRLGEANWWGRPDDELSTLLSKVTPSLAGLVGRTLRYRITTRPVDATAVTRGYDASIRDPRDMGEWAGHLNRVRDWMMDVRPGCAPGGIVETNVYAGVSLGKPVRVVDNPEKTAAAWAKLADDEASVSQLLAGRGLHGSPLDTGGIGWLLHRSIAPGLDPPALVNGEWGPDDFRNLQTQYRRKWRPGMPTVLVHADRVDGTVTRHAIVLTVGRMEARNFPEDGTAPWLAYAARMPFPVEVVASGKVIAGKSLVDKFDMKRRWSEDIIKHHGDHDEAPPEDALQAQERAAELFHEAKTGSRPAIARWHGVVRMVVPGETQQEAVSNARMLAQGYLEDEGVELVRPGDQLDAMRELVPGERAATDSFQRRMKVGYLAAGVPNVTGKLGNTAGMPLGYTTGDTPGRLVRLDRHFAMEHLRKSGLRLTIAQPGSGKSGLALRIMDVAALEGDAVLCVDPPGEMAAICHMPRHRNHSLHLDLAAARPGTFDCRRLIPWPDRDDFDDDDKWRAEKARVPELRVALLVDSMSGLLTESVRARDGMEEVLGDAASRADADPWGMLDILDETGRRDERVAMVARELRRAAHGHARILFPDANRPLDEDGLESYGLVVMTLNGMSMPDPHSPRKDWGIEERASVVTTHLAAHYVRRFMHIRPRSERKDVIWDEFHWLASWKDGPAVARTINRDSRRRDTFALFGSQHGGDAKALDPSGELFTAGGFLGRQEKYSSAQASLEQYDLPLGIGYEEVLADLGNGEFLHVDDQGLAGTFQVDVESMDPELFEVVNLSTPDADRVKR